MNSCLPIYKTIFANSETDEDFTLTQLEKLLPLGKEKIEVYLHTGHLKYSMTVKEIKDFVSEIKSLEKKSEETEPETEETEPEKEETEPETEETETETESKECVATIEIWNNCIFVNDEKYDFNDLNEVVKYIRKTVKGLNK